MKIFKFISNYITKHAKTLSFLVALLMLVAAVIAAVAGVWGIVVGYKGIDQQEKIYKTTKVEQEYPFF